MSCAPKRDQQKEKKKKKKRRMAEILMNDVLGKDGERSRRGLF
jgi:hypothetical protein